MAMQQHSTQAPIAAEDPISHPTKNNYPIRRPHKDDDDDHGQGRSATTTTTTTTTTTSSTRSNSTCTTALSASDRMDWTITSHNNEHTDCASDGDEELTVERVVAATTTCIVSKMKLVPEEPVSFIPSSNDSIRKNTNVEFAAVERIVQEIEPELKDDTIRVPTSVQIQLAYIPSSPSQRMRKSVGGTLRRQVHFHQVQIRRYPMIAGDNPACQMGAPVQLDWGFEELPALDLDDFEATRCLTRRRKLHHLILNYFQRNRILKGMGYTDDEIIQTEKDVGRDRFRRGMTQLIVPLWKLEDCIQSLCRKVKRKVDKAERQKKEEVDRMIQMLQERDASRL